MVHQLVHQCRENEVMKAFTTFNPSRNSLIGTLLSLKQKTKGDSTVMATNSSFYISLARILSSLSCQNQGYSFDQILQTSRVIILSAAEKHSSQFLEKGCKENGTCIRIQAYR